MTGITIKYVLFILNNMTLDFSMKRCLTSNCTFSIFFYQGPKIVQQCTTGSSVRVLWHARVKWSWTQLIHEPKTPGRLHNCSLINANQWLWQQRSSTIPANVFFRVIFVRPTFGLIERSWSGSCYTDAGHSCFTLFCDFFKLSIGVVFLIKWEGAEFEEKSWLNLLLCSTYVCFLEDFRKPSCFSPVKIISFCGQDVTRSYHCTYPLWHFYIQVSFDFDAYVKWSGIRLFTLNEPSFCLFCVHLNHPLNALMHKLL